MHDLRSELEAYAATGEPPMGLTFDEVVTTARRKQYRRRATVIASGVAAAATVAIAVPTLLAAPNSPPDTGAVVTNKCKAETDHANRMRCVVTEQVTPLLPADTKLIPAKITRPRGHGTGVMFDVRRAGSPEPVATLEVYVDGPQPGYCAAAPCPTRTGPHGEKVFYRPIRGTDDYAKPPHSLHLIGLDVAVGGKNVQVMQALVPTPGSRPYELISEDAMFKLATTPELLP